ncbi:HNH endonuclease [Crateriforma conspicua]|uniref:HNH endonuclease n=1 Tax=Crateriforma conspicua TaxID=2527996 RepID=A0A5C5XRQ4_9PLAN|nr:HNH endonuclease [Crateriforma conspicua]TWT65877.1 HNH endonuclease [Crateriforma conspicua]
MARKSLSKKLRFEVLKRDSFQCQYCGASAPNVLLQIDHVTPVASGGTDDILNLITSCFDCNSGKGARELDDDAALVKQQNQLQELNERREQLELMIQWKEELSQLKETTVDRIAQYWSKRVGGFTPTETGLQTLRRLAKKHAYSDVIDAIDTAVDIYVKYDDDVPTHESIETAFTKINGILRTNDVAKSKPYIRDLYYIRGILRNRGYVNERYVMELLEEAAEADIPIDDLKSYAARCSSWTDFRETVEDLIEADNADAM